MTTKFNKNKGKKPIKSNPLQKKSLQKKVQEEEELAALNTNKFKLQECDPTTLTSFDKFPLSKKTSKGLQACHFKEPTKIQQLSLVHSLRGLDVVGAAKTGSGKTLAFIIPLLELLLEKKWSDMDGIGALVITPLRELAYQIYEVLNQVGKHHEFSVGLIIGGKDLKFEWKRVDRCNIMICTPGRILQHMNENPEFNCDNVQLLVLDEADKCLSMGFAQDMNAILNELPKKRQTLLFSATQTRDVKNLIRAGCKDPIFCSADEHAATVTPITLKESYVICNEEDKLTFLWSFVSHHKYNKALVFLATCKQVRYYNELFCHLRPGLPVMALHGNMNQMKRMKVYKSFCLCSRGIMFVTDVASRGWDIPKINWVLQLDCPEDVTTYIHRAGRTARHKNTGESILVLTPSQEKGMIKDLKTKSIEVEKIDVDPSKLKNIRTKVGMFLNKYNGLREATERAFKSYLKDYCLMKNKEIFDVESIDFEEYAKSLGLASAPRVRYIEKLLKKKSVFSINAIIDGMDYIQVTKDENQEIEDQNVENTPLLYDEPIYSNEDNLYAETTENDSDEDWSCIADWLQIIDESKKSDKVRERQIRKDLFRQKQSKNEDAENDVFDNSRSDGQEDSESEMDSFTQNLIDELPDPDEIRNRESSSSSDQNDSDSEMSSDESDLESDNARKPIKKRVFKGKKLAIEKYKQAKRAKLETDNSLTSIPFNEKEDLALYLLKSGK